MNTKTIQGKLWSIAPEKWSRHFEPWFLPMYKTALDQLHLSASTLLLDAGCGSGMFSSMAIQSGAQVIGIDAAPGLLEIARLRNPENNFMEEELEQLPFAANSFDVVTGFNSFQYAGSFENVLKEAKRVLTPGGKLIIGIWDKPEKSQATDVLKSIGSLLPPPPAGTPGPFALSEDGRIESELEKAGLSMLSRKTVACPFLFTGLQEGIDAFMGTGPAAAALNSHAKEKVEQTIATTLRKYHITDHFYFLQNSFLVFIAEK